MNAASSKIGVARDATEIVLDTHQKALAINLDQLCFGSFAEIGAGQEVARWFLRVGGASGTVAKTISAYDKQVSDDLYGSGTRYVSRPRLEDMLTREWKALLSQVGETRGGSTRFFAFANTVSARNFSGTNDCHGWIGVRFQTHPRSEPSDALIHVNLRDDANLLQQEAVGIVGVNLLHALMMERVILTTLPSRLFDGLSINRIEIDLIDAKGPAFAGGDPRSLHARLASEGRAESVACDADGTTIAANELFYKKAVVIVPVAASADEAMSEHAINACIESLRPEIAGSKDASDVMHVTLSVVDPDSALATPASLGAGAKLITPHRQLFRTTAFLRRYTNGPLRFAMTLPGLARIFDEARDQKLDSRMLEGISRLFAHNVKVLAHPSRRAILGGALARDADRPWTIEGSGEWVTADQIRPPSAMKHLYEYLLAFGFLVVMKPDAKA